MAIIGNIPYFQTNPYVFDEIWCVPNSRQLPKNALEHQWTSFVRNHSYKWGRDLSSSQAPRHVGSTSTVARSHTLRWYTEAHFPKPGWLWQKPIPPKVHHHDSARHTMERHSTPSKLSLRTLILLVMPSDCVVDGCHSSVLFRGTERLSLQKKPTQRQYFRSIKSRE